MDERVDRTETRRAPDPASRVTPVVHQSRRGYWILISLILAGLVGGGWYLWTHHETQQAPETATAGRSAQGAPQPVGFATIDKGDIRIILNELGTVTSLDTVTVQTQINGQLQQVGFRKARWSRRATSWRRSTRAPIRRRWSRRRARWRMTRGCWQQAQTDLKRYQTLGRQDSIAQQQVDDQHYPGAAVHRHGADRPGRGRHRQAQPGLLPHHLADRRPGRAAAGRSPATTSRPATPPAWS